MRRKRDIVKVKRDEEKYCPKGLIPCRVGEGVDGYEVSILQFESIQAEI
jgi:hypothetical protein